MSIFEFLERLDKDPWDPALTDLFLPDDIRARRSENVNSMCKDCITDCMGTSRKHYSGCVYRESGKEETQ